MLLAVCVAAGAGWAADSFSATTSGGYGRILLSLDSGGTPKAQISGSVLVITFPNKVTGSAAAVARGLGGYVVSARTDADGMAFRFALSRPVRLHVSSAAGQTAIDLVPSSYKGTPPALQPPQRKSADDVPIDMDHLPTLKVRSGEYRNFTRLVFDWSRNVPYTVVAGSGRLAVRFAAPATVDMTALSREAPPWVKPAGSHLDGHSTVVEFTTDADSGYHDFRDGTHVVVDVLAPRTDAGAYHPPGDGHPGVAETHGARASAPAHDGVGTHVSAQDSERNFGRNSAAESATAGAVREAADALNTPALNPRGPAPAANSTVTIAASPGGGGLVMTVPDASTLQIAALARGAMAWVVLQGGPALDLAKVKSLSKLVQSADTVTGSGASILRLVMRWPTQVSVGADGRALRIVVAPHVQVQGTDIAFESSQDATARAVLSATLSRPGNVLTLNDPLVKDKIVVVPVNLGQAVKKARTLTDFALLPTAAGVALTPFADDVTVTSSESRVSIFRGAGLTLTQNTGLDTVLPQRTAGEEDRSFLDFARWQKPIAGSFLATERALRERAIHTGGNGGDEARLALARFFLANGFDPETMGMLDLLQGRNAAPPASGQLQVMRAAAQYGMGRYKDAYNSLAGAAFDGDRHAALWRGLADTKMENYARAWQNLMLAAEVIKAYRPDIQAEMRLAAAECAMGLGHSEDARRQLDQLPGEIPEKMIPQANLLRARLYDSWGDTHSADAYYAQVEHSPDRESAAKAVYYRIEAGVRGKSMPVSEAINGLERLRYRWRGDALEVKTLNLLATLYGQQQRWRDQLSILQILAHFIPERDIANAAQDQMRRLFSDLFLKGRADNMPPIDALGLFYDYDSLTPIGSDGDEMIRRMAERLTKVDLLTPAADLLKYQITNRLDGMARAQVAARLAAVQLMDHKPKEALDTLLTTRISAMPDEVAHQRMLLQARALADLKRWDEALDLIDVDNEPDTQLMRADIVWRSGNWPEAGKLYEAQLGTLWHEPQPFTEEERQTVMRMAVAYAQAGDEAAIARIRARYTAKMRDTPDAAAFGVVTGRTDMNGMAFRDAAAKVASTNTLQSFMQGLEKKGQEKKKTAE